MKHFKTVPACAGFALLTACGTATPPAQNESGPSAAAGIFMQIVPPGANGNSAGAIGGPVPGQPQLVFPDNFRDQLDLYGNLAYAQQGLKAETCTPPADIDAHAASSDQACNYFKNAPIELPPEQAVSTRTLTAPNGQSVTLRRDGWGVPYVEGADRASAQYGMGYAAAEDRLWLFDVLRQVGRGRVSEFLGPSPTTYDLDVQFGGAGGYSEEELTQLVNAAVSKITPELGQVFLSDTENFVAGMNAYIDFLLTPQGARFIPPEYLTLALQVPPAFPPREFTVNDIVANAVLIQAQFGRGGGGEASNLRLLQALDASFTAGATTIPKAACDLWRDLRHSNDPQTPYTTDLTFNTQSPPSVSETCPQTLPPGAAIWDPGSLQGRPFLVRESDPLALPLVGQITGGLIGIPSIPFPPTGTVARAHPPLKSAAGAGEKLLASADPTAAMHAALGALGVPKVASNWIGVNGDQTRDGHPIIVAGPQTSYFAPQLLWEAAVVSKGGTPLDLAARGISTVNLPYVVIGRGLDFGWSATSAGSDLIDTRVSRLCNTDGSPASRDDNDGDGFPDADGYLFKGSCVRLFRRLDEWIAAPTPASIALGGPQQGEQVRRYIVRTHYGPVIATATVNGEPVAISEQRSTFFGDVDTTAPFALLTTQGLKMNHVKFKELFNSMTSTFNWIYSDARDLAYIQSGLYPIRHPGHHPELPVWGDGNFEWAADQNLGAEFFAQFGGDGNEGALSFPSRAVPVVQGDPLQGYFEWPGYLPLSAHIQDVNPPKGYLANWNNSGAPGWWAADSNGTYGPTHRNALLEARLLAFRDSGRQHDVGSMIEIMADAAFTDLRGQDLVPLLLEIMERGELTPDQQAVAALMRAWRDAGSQQWISGEPGLGSYRRDRDQDGVYDQRAPVVLMDAWYHHLLSSLTPQLLALEQAGTPTLTSRYDAPRAQGSAYQEGWYQHMKKLLEVTLGRSGIAPYRALRCADGSFEGCRSGVLAALDSALADLGGLAAQADWEGHSSRFADCPPGSPLPAPLAGAGGCAVEDYDSVRHTAFSFQPVPAIHWTNRPTFQQVTQVLRDRDGQP